MLFARNRTRTRRKRALRSLLAGLDVPADSVDLLIQYALHPETPSAERDNVVLYLLEHDLSQEQALHLGKAAFASSYAVTVSYVAHEAIPLDVASALVAENPLALGEPYAAYPPRRVVQACRTAYRLHMGQVAFLFLYESASLSEAAWETFLQLLEDDLDLDVHALLHISERAQMARLLEDSAH